MHLLRDSLKKKKLSRNLLSSFVSVDLYIWTTSQLLYRSIPIRIYGSPGKCSHVVYWNFLEKSINVSYPGSVKAVRLIFSVDGN